MTSKTDTPVSVRLGGRYTRDNETGELVREADIAPVPETAPSSTGATTTETMPQEKTAPKGKGS